MCITADDADDGLIIATCSEDSSVLFYNTLTQAILMHWSPFKALLPQPPLTGYFTEKHLFKLIVVDN